MTTKDPTGTEPNEFLEKIKEIVKENNVKVVTLESNPVKEWVENEEAMYSVTPENIRDFMPSYLPEDAEFMPSYLPEDAELGDNVYEKYKQESVTYWINKSKEARKVRARERSSKNLRELCEKIKKKYKKDK